MVTNTTLLKTKPTIKESRKACNQLDTLLKRCKGPTETKIVLHLFEHGKKTRLELVDETKTKRTTAIDALVRLQVKGLVNKETMNIGHGRPRVYWSLIIKSLGRQ